MDTPLATLRPSAPRLWFTAACLAAFAALLLWIAVVQPPDGLGWRGFLAPLRGPRGLERRRASTATPTGR